MSISNKKFFYFNLSAVMLILIVLGITDNPIIIFLKSQRRATRRMATIMTLDYLRPDFSSLQQFTRDRIAPVDFNSLIRYYQEAAKLPSPNDKIGVYHILGFCHYYAGDEKNAILHLKQSIREEPYFYWSYHDLALIYIKHKQFDTSFEILSKAQNIHPREMIQELLGSRACIQLIAALGIDSNQVKDNLLTAYQQDKQLIVYCLMALGHKEKAARLAKQFGVSPAEESLLNALKDMHLTLF